MPTVAGSRFADGAWQVPIATSPAATYARWGSEGREHDAHPQRRASDGCGLFSPCGLRRRRQCGTLWRRLALSPAVTPPTRISRPRHSGARALQSHAERTGTGGKPPGLAQLGQRRPGISANIAAHPSGAVYLASMGGGVRKSNDFGATWTSVNAGLPPAALSFAMDASGPDTVYVGVFSAAATAPGGVFKSTDGGTTWVLSPATANVAHAGARSGPEQPGDRLHRRAYGSASQDDERRSDLDDSVLRHVAHRLGTGRSHERPKRLPGDAGRRVPQHRRRRDLDTHGDADRTERVGHRN